MAFKQNCREIRVAHNSHPLYPLRYMAVHRAHSTYTHHHTCGMYCVQHMNDRTDLQVPYCVFSIDNGFINSIFSTFHNFRRHFLSQTHTHRVWQHTNGMPFWNVNNFLPIRIYTKRRSHRTDTLSQCNSIYLYTPNISRMANDFGCERYFVFLLRRSRIAHGMHTAISLSHRFRVLCDVAMRIRGILLWLVKKKQNNVRSIKFRAADFVYTALAAMGSNWWFVD